MSTKKCVCVEKLFCLHTYSHTAGSRLLSCVNGDYFLSVFSHNPPQYLY